MDEKCRWSGKGSKLNWEIVGLQGWFVMVFLTTIAFLGVVCEKVLLVTEVAARTGAAVNQPVSLCVLGSYFP